MKWLKEKYSRIPRPIRTAIQLGLVPLLLLICYIVIQTPTFTALFTLRLAEKSELVGPGRILGIVQNPEYPTTEVIVAEDDHGFIFCRYYTNNPFVRPLLTYREKQGDLTLLACPFFLPDEDKRRLPVLLFCDDPKAEYAEVDITITVPWDGKDTTFTYSLCASRATEGYFLFHIDIMPYKGSDAEYRALDTFARVSLTNYGTPDSGSEIHATVRLYTNHITKNPDGTVTVRQPSDLYKSAQLTIDSVADDAVARFENP